MHIDNEGDKSRNEYLFHHLVVMFQTLALQQLGKLMNPITGKMERDLQQARITIDMLQMIREKTAGNVTDREKGLLDGVLMDLQLNYIDELNRGEGKPAEMETEEEGEREAEGAVAGEGDVTRGAAEKEAEPEESDKKERASKKFNRRKTTKRKTAKRTAKTKKANSGSDSRK